MCVLAKWVNSPIRLTVELGHCFLCRSILKQTNSLISFHLFSLHFLVVVVVDGHTVMISVNAPEEEKEIL